MYKVIGKSRDTELGEKLSRVPARAIPAMSIAKLLHLNHLHDVSYPINFSKRSAVRGLVTPFG